MPDGKRASLAAVAREGRILVSDGAWGTMLFRKGMARDYCPELWCVEHPDEVRGIAASYFAAGADMVGTNSFGGTRIRLARRGLEARARELNEAAARLSREAALRLGSAGEGKWVLGSMGPTGRKLATGEITTEEMRVAFSEQAEALARGGADALCVETMMDAEEAAIAVRAAKESSGLEVLCTFTFSKAGAGRPRTMTGLSPEAAVLAALDAGADIVGANCGEGFADMVEVLRAMGPAARGAPIMAQPNAGLPRTEGSSLVYPEGPDYAAALAPVLLDAGASILGGCCGTTPEHVAAIRRAVDAYTASRPRAGAQKI
jgi:5-methyltetrahydrofolate--homocysteine methyltransferase